MSDRRPAHDQIRVSELQILRVCLITREDAGPSPDPITIYVVCRNENHLFGYPLIPSERRYRFSSLTYYRWHSACWWPQKITPDELEDLFLQQMCENEIDCHRIRMEAILTLLNLEC